MRLITDDGVAASFGLAADETLAQRVGLGASPPTLRLYTYRSHCALVGRFQNVENEIHMDYCRAHGVDVNRRPTGGGAIIMGAEQLGVALTLPGREGTSYCHARELMEHFSGGLLRGLKRLGVAARFRRKNDIEVQGCKLVGLGIFRASSGGLLFHASVLVDLDVPLMLHVIKTPFEKITDKEIESAAARTSTVRREVGREISMDDVRAIVADGYAQAFNAELSAAEFSAAERREAQVLERSKYRSDAWVFRRTAVADASGTAKVKTPAGLLDVRVTLAGRMLKAVYIGGDFFTAENAVAELEERLRWHPRHSERVAATVEDCYRRQPDLGGIPMHALCAALHKAIRRAKNAETRARSDPYACFVNPEAAIA